MKPSDEFGRAGSVKYTEEFPPGLDQSGLAEWIAMFEGIAIELAMNVRMTSTAKNIICEFNNLADQMLFRERLVEAKNGPHDFIYTHVFAPNDLGFKHTWTWRTEEVLDDAMMEYRSEMDHDRVHFHFRSLAAMYMLSALVESGYLNRAAEFDHARLVSWGQVDPR